MVAKGNNTYYYHTGDIAESPINVTATTGAKVFINGEETSSYTASANAKAVQILVQSESAAPYILVID